MATVKIDPSIPTYDKMSDEQRAGYEKALAVLSKMPMGLGYDASIELQKKMRPKYDVNKVYDENIALAKGNLYAPDRQAQMAQLDIDEAAAQGMGAAQQFSGSTSALLDTFATITGNKTKALRGLASDQAALKQSKLATLMGANVAKAEEQDKAWNFNVNQPYQLQLNQTVEEEKFRRENEFNLLDAIGSIASFIPGIGGLVGQGISALGGKKKRSNVVAATPANYWDEETGSVMPSYPG